MSIFEKQPVLSEHVVICIPTNGTVHSQFAFCLVNAIQYTESHGIPTTLVMDAGTVLSNQRQVLLNTAIDEQHAMHIMWLDSDMIFPSDTIIRLLEHKKDAVCATYSKRTPPFHPTAFYSIDPVVPVDTTKTGLDIVRYSGMGCMLITAAAIDSMTSPHFPLVWHAPSSTWHGEDMGFCDLLDHNDIKLFCDLALSCEIGHLGLKEFRVNEVG